MKPYELNRAVAIKLVRSKHRQLCDLESSCERLSDDSIDRGILLCVRDDPGVDRRRSKYGANVRRKNRVGERKKRDIDGSGHRVSELVFPHVCTTLERSFRLGKTRVDNFRHAVRVRDINHD